MLIKTTILLIAIAATNCELPSYIKVCNSKTTNLTECIINSIEEIRPKLVEGIAELNVPAIEPLDLDTVKLRSGPRQAKIDANITNVKVWGASGFKILDLQPNLQKNKFAFKGLVPQLHFEGDYDIDMNLLLLKFKGQGPITGNFTDYTFDCILRGKKVQREGKTYLNFRRMALQLTIGKSTLKLGNLFPNDPQIAKATDEVIQENSNIFIEEIKPVLENSLAQKFTDIANTITTQFTYDELFPN